MSPLGQLGADLFQYRRRAIFVLLGPERDLDTVRAVRVDPTMAAVGSDAFGSSVSLARIVAAA